MWWFDRARSLRRAPLRAVAASLLCAFVISGCGYEPLYGKRNSEVSSANAALIAISPVRDRLAREVRNQLLDGLTPEGEPSNPRYQLSFDVEERTNAVLIQLDDTTTRFNLILTASFTLTDLENGTVLYTDNARAEGSFNVVDSEFATVIAEQDAGREATRELSDEIRSLVLVFFSRLQQ
jgi:LPS-assembly lipoprotein